MPVPDSLGSLTGRPKPTQNRGETTVGDSDQCMSPTAPSLPDAELPAEPSTVASGRVCHRCGSWKPIEAWSPSNRVSGCLPCRSCANLAKASLRRRHRLSQSGLLADGVTARRVVAILSERPHLLDDAEAACGIETARSIARTALAACREILTEEAEIERLQAELRDA